MWIKVVIITLLAAIVLSLSGGLVFLLKDKSKTNRLVNSLLLRVTLSIALLGVMVYGFLSGELVSRVPW